MKKSVKIIIGMCFLFHLYHMHIRMRWQRSDME